jgi:hypothetical protein
MRTFLASTSLGAALAGLGVKYDEIFVPANAMIPEATAGATAAQTVEASTNKNMVEYLAFTSSSTTYADFYLTMPPTWDRSTIKVKFLWIPATGCTQGDQVRWELEAVAVSNDDNWDAAHGTSQGVSDTVTAGVEDDLHISAATSALTVGGSPALGDLIHFKVFRDHDHADDDMTEDAWLIGIQIQYGSTNEVSQW